MYGDIGKLTMEDIRASVGDLGGYCRLISLSG